MKSPKEIHTRLIEKYGAVINLKDNPGLLLDLLAEVERSAGNVSHDTSPRAPFGVSWMDSWVAHWVYNENLRTTDQKDKEMASALRGLVDLQFNARLNEIKRFILDHPNFTITAPDGGPPEPGTPPAGPASVFSPPDGGVPEPGVPPAGPHTAFQPPHRRASEPGVPPAGPRVAFEPPDGGTPEPGVPPAPEPPTGPDAGFLNENPWILYWFISIKAPLVLDVIDAHITRRFNELQEKLARK